MDNGRRRGLLKFLILVVVLAGLWYLNSWLKIDFQYLEDSLKGRSRIYAGGVFVFLYVVSTLAFWVSKDILKLIGALIFGAYFSTLCIWIAEVLNAAILFHLARYLGRGFVEKKLRASKGFDEKLGKVNFLWLFMFRAVPLIPFRFLDLAAGLTKISFGRYLVAVIFGSPLRIFWIQYVLAGVGKAIFTNPLAASDYLMKNQPVLSLTLVYFILVIIVALRLKRKA